jgi:tetratricopeptide (TPR) repeat protein
MVSTDTLNEEAPPSSALEIEVLVAGIAFGPFTEAKLRERLDEGLVALNDKARLVNTEEWIPLEEVLARLPAEPEPAPETPSEAVPVPEAKAEPAEAEIPPAPSLAESKTVKMEPAAPGPPQRPSLGQLIGEKTGGLRRLATGPLPAPDRTTSRISKTGLKSGNLLGPTPPGATPGRGLRSQIMARTSQAPLTLSPSAPPLGQSIAKGTLRLPTRTNTTGPLSIPKPAPAESATAKISPPEHPAASPSSTAPVFRFRPTRAPATEPPVARPESTLPPEEVPTSRLPTGQPFPEPGTFGTETRHDEPSHADPAAHATPSTRAVSVEALASPTPPPPTQPPPAILPAKPATERPPSDPDSVITAHIPARRTQLIKMLPGQAVRASQKLTDTSLRRPPSVPEAPPETKFPRLPGQAPAPPVEAKKSFTSPLPAPSRPPAPRGANPGTQTLASVASPPPPDANAIRKVRRGGMGDASAMAATTLLPTKANPSEVPNFPAETTSAPAQDDFDEFDETEDPDEPPTERTALIEVRRAALKSARLKRQRQSIIYASVGLLLIILLAAGIFHYAFSSHEKAQPAPAPAATTPTPPPAAPVTSPPVAPAPTTPENPAATAPAPSPALNTAPAPAPTPATNAAPATNAPPVTMAPPPAAPAPPADPKVLAHIKAGQADQAKGDLDGALGEFTQALILDPKNAQAYSFRAVIKLAKGDADGAVADDNALLTLEPNNANGFCQRGFVKQSKGDLDGALADYTRAIALDPKAYIAFYNRGMIEEDKNQTVAALADYNATLDLNPQLAGAFYHRGNMKMNQTDLDGAVADYTHALQLNPKIALAYCNRALAEQNTGSLDVALNDYNQAITLDPKISMAYYNRGLIKEQRGDFEGCIDDSTQALQIDPSNAQAYYNRGVALQAKGNLDAAANDLRKFGELAPKNVYADYAHLYLWIIGCEENHKPQANLELSTCLVSSWNAEPAQLTSKIANFLLDQINEEDLMTVATSTDTKKDRGQHCEVWYFDGIKKLINGDKGGAVTCFTQCLTTGEKDYCEYILAQAQLQSLSQAKLSASPG